MADWLERRAGASPQALAVLDGATHWTWAALDAQATSLAGRLVRLGIMPGDVVATRRPSSAAHIALLHALARIGAVAAPLDPRLAEPEFVLRLRLLRAPLLVAEGGEGPEGSIVLEGTRTIALPALAAMTPARFKPVAAEPERVHSIIFTSGTSGEPRAAMLTFGNHEASARASAANLGETEADRWLACVPLFHVGGLAIVARTVLNGSSLVVQPRFDAREANAAIDDEGVTLASMVPVMLRRVLDERAGRVFPLGLRAVLLGGDAAPPGLLADARAAGLRVLPTYGLTEACSQVATASPEDAARPAGAVGLPLPGIDLRILDEAGEACAEGQPGEIVLRGPNVFAGYFRDPEATARVFRGGALHTRDLGFLDAQGCLHVVGRLGDRIVTGGEKVDPVEVEEALRSHPSVLDAGVVGLPSAEWGQQLAAAVVLRADDAFDAAALDRHVRARLAGFKVPRQWKAVKDLPRTASGKLRRIDLRNLFDPRAAKD